MKEHTIETIAELVEIITPENAEEIKEGVTSLIEVIARAKKIARTVGGTGNEVKLRTFKWIDDGKHKTTVKIS